MTDLEGPHVQGKVLLDAIDSNLRREHGVGGHLQVGFPSPDTATALCRIAGEHSS